MSTTQLDPTTSQDAGVAAVPMKFEVTTLPVADVGRTPRSSSDRARRR